jgi:YegS/Rv2252/BmrU family lipid kinase
MQKKYYLILNPNARQISNDNEGFLKVFADQGIKIEKVFELKKSNNLEKFLSEIEPESSIILVASGDGAVSSVIDHFAYTEAIIGIIPMGTANSFARSLGIPLDLVESLSIIKSNNCVEIDLGKIGDDYFANTANIGISALINQSVDNYAKSVFGRGAYLLSVIYHLIFAKSFGITITDKNNKKHSYKCVEVLIANGKYQGGVNLAPDASLKNNQIHLRIIKSSFMSKFKLMIFWIGRVFEQTWFEDIIVDLKGESFFVETKPILQIDIDGEASVKTPFELSVAPKAIKIITKKI